MRGVKAQLGYQHSKLKSKGWGYKDLFINGYAEVIFNKQSPLDSP